MDRWELCPIPNGEVSSAEHLCKNCKKEGTQGLALVMWRRGMGTAQTRPASVDPNVRTPFLEPQPAELDRWPGCKKHIWKCNVKAVRFYLTNISVNPSARALFCRCLRDEEALRWPEVHVILRHRPLSEDHKQMASYVSIWFSAQDN